MFCCHYCSSTGSTTFYKKVVIYSLLGLGLVMILIFAILFGLRVIEIGSLSSVPPKCLELESPCGLEDENEIDVPRCCSPYVCRVQNLLLGEKTTKCLPENDSHTTTTKRSTTSSSCPYSAKLEQILQPVRNPDKEVEKTLEFYDSAMDSYFTLSAHRGNLYRNYLLTVRELNTEARHLIGTTTEKVGSNIFPLIVATESSFDQHGIGGTFTLYLEDGSIQSVNPVDEEYEIRKGLGHIPVAIFDLLAPYFQVSHAPKWRKDLSLFGGKVNDTLMTVRVLAASKTTNEINQELLQDSLEMLEISAKYIDLWVKQSQPLNSFMAPKTITVLEFQKYSKEIFPYLDKGIQIAAELQMKAVVPELLKWRAQIGEKRWRSLYAVIPTIWHVTGINPRFQALAAVMSPEQAKTQVFNLESGGSGGTVEEMRKVLGRIIAHRAAAHLIFGTETQRGKEFKFAMSGRQDLMSIDAEDALRTMKAIGRTFE